MKRLVEIVVSDMQMVITKSLSSMPMSLKSRSASANCSSKEVEGDDSLLPLRGIGSNLGDYSLAVGYPHRLRRILMSIKVIIVGFKEWDKQPYKMVSEDPEPELAGLIDPFTDETEVAGSPCL